MKDPNWFARKARRYVARQVGKRVFGPQFEPARPQQNPYHVKLEPKPAAPPKRHPDIPTEMALRLLKESVWGGSMKGSAALFIHEMRALFQSISDTVGRVAQYLPAAVNVEDMWKTALRDFAKDIGLHADEAIAFVERGESPEGKGARLSALVAAYDLGGRDGAMALVFSDVAEVA